MDKDKENEKKEDKKKDSSAKNDINMDSPNNLNKSIKLNKDDNDIPFS